MDWIGAERIGLERIGWEGKGLERKVFLMSDTQVFLNDNQQPIWPDTSGLAKGDLLPESVLAEIVKAAPGTAKFAFRVMWLKKKISKDLAARGMYVTLAVKRGSLAILTDAEADGYNAQFAKTGVRRIRRSAARHAAIDLTKLTAEQRIEWDQNSRRLGMMVSSLSPKTLPAMQPHQRLK